MRNLKALVAAAMLVAAPAYAQGAGAQGGWQMTVTPASDGGKSCAMGKLGPEVNTRLLRNKTGQMILIAARGDWNNSDPIAPKLSIDGAPAKRVLAQTVGPLVLVLVDQPELEAKLRPAKTLQWTMPWGVFNAQVEGLGAAYDQLADC
jgi:hypothetical protein